MANINANLLRVPKSYLFRDIGNRVSAFMETHPDADIIKLGIGDAVQPIGRCIASAGAMRCADMASAEGFAGYPNEWGMMPLREAISRRVYGRAIPADNIFVSTGAKEDSGGIQDLFSLDTKVLVPNPVYPVYVNTNLMYGRTDIGYLEGNAINGFLPEIPTDIEDSCIIYLCFPNNPTGQVADRGYLKAWVDFADRTGSVIIFDAAYSAFIQSSGIPRSIFDVDGAQRVAIEIGSFSKSHSFTGIRVGWTAIGKEVELSGLKHAYKVRDLWANRQAYRTNGVSHILQAMALEALSDEGMEASRIQVAGTIHNALLMGDTLRELGLNPVGGIDAPYVWCPTPDGMSGWDFFDLLLSQCSVVCTPGEGFGTAGANHFRLSAFAHTDKVAEALERIKRLRL
jgi:LL-diaminopimelate aminotransferase